MSDPLSIPTSPDEPFYEQQSTIDGVDYTLTFRYNQREKCFYLTIGDVDGVDIVKGIKLVCNWSLLLGHDDARLPRGRFMVLSHVTGNDDNPDLGDLGEGRRCVFYYFPYDAAEETERAARFAAARITPR